jgi:hypothetical protein
LLGGAKTSGLKLGEGSTLIIASGFKLSGFVVNPYQILKVFAGGFASATKVTNGAEAEEDISSGGSDRRATLMGANNSSTVAASPAARRSQAAVSNSSGALQTARPSRTTGTKLSAAGARH